MTDANLMEADCIHGLVWYNCLQCKWDLEDITGSPVDNSIVAPVGSEDSRETPTIA